MKRQTILTLALLLTGCAVTPPGADRQGAERLPGTWLMMYSKADRDIAACSSGLPISYAANGTYSLFDEGGIWRLDGNRLTETATEAYDTIDPAEVAIGKPFISTIRWIGRDAFEKIFTDGKRMIFRRCVNAG